MYGFGTSSLKFGEQGCPLLGHILCAFSSLRPLPDAPPPPQLHIAPFCPQQSCCGLFCAFRASLPFSASVRLKFPHFKFTEVFLYYNTKDSGARIRELRLAKKLDQIRASRAGGLAGGKALCPALYASGLDIWIRLFSETSYQAKARSISPRAFRSIQSRNPHCRQPRRWCR